MFKISGASTSRKTGIGEIVEDFIDSYTTEFSVSQLEMLEDLAKEVDEAALILEKQLEDEK